MFGVTLIAAGCDGGGGGGGDRIDAAVLVSPLSGATTEAGGQASFTMALQGKPSADVTFALVSGDVTEGLISPSSVTFTAENYAAPQTVLVTGQDDDEADGSTSFPIAIDAPVTEDDRFLAIDPPDPIVVNIDDETAGLTASAVDVATTENGGQASFTVVLHSRPTADVTLALFSSAITEGTLPSQSVTFTALDWNAPQTVFVTGADDEIADGSQEFSIVITPSSADPAYDALVVPPVSVVNIDNDSAGILVSAPVVAMTTEAGASTSFTVRLASKPLADVTVNFASSDPTEGVPTVTSRVFTPVDYAAPKTVTVNGVGDLAADGDQPYAIVFSATDSADAAYAAITPASVPLTNTDDDSAGITVSAVSGATTEAGGQASFTIALTSQPSVNVTVNFDTNDATEGVPGVVSRTFTSGNFATPQTVIVTGQNDLVADGNQAYAIVFTPTTSGDSGYAGRIPANVSITNVDDDSAGIAVSAISGATSEGGGAATFTIALRSQPTSDVTVNFASDDATEGLTNVTSRTFTNANYATPQSVTVTGVDDLLLDGDQSCQIAFGATSSSDPRYSSLTPANIPVTNIGNDVPRKVLVIHASAIVAHAGDVETKLEATGAFEAVDRFDASAATPSQAELGAYRSILVMNDTAPWSNATLLGDVLANHFDAGNQVVLANFTHSAGIGGSAIGGRFATVGSNGYMLLDESGTVATGAATLGTAGLPGHFLLRDVSALSATNAHRNSAALPDGVVRVSSWSDGAPLVVTRTYANDRVRADLNLSAPSNDVLAGSWIGDGAALLRNALLYTSAVAPVDPPPPPPPGDPTPDVGYYSMSLGQGDADQVASITAAGGVAVNLLDLSAADLAGLEVLYVQNAENGSYGSEYTSRLAAIDTAVQAGMTLIIHDRFVTNAASILPGGGGIVFTRLLGSDIQVLDATTLVTNGPAGLIDNTSLDGGTSSTHGHASPASFPLGATSILSTGNASQVVTFAYPRGAGMVIYSGIPLDFYLDQAGTTGVTGNMKRYATNVVAYGIQQSQN